jgi:hypothetical protein
LLVSRVASWQVLDREDTTEYSYRFLAQLEVTEQVWGALVSMNMKGKPTNEQDKAREKFLACAFLAGVDKSRYKTVIDELNNDFVLGNDNYPGDVAGMLSRLTNRRGGTSSTRRMEAMQDGEVLTNFGQGVSWHANAICHRCGTKGHIARNCNEDISDSDSQGSSNAQTGIRAVGAQAIGEILCQLHGVEHLFRELSSEMIRLQE